MKHFLTALLFLASAFSAAAETPAAAQVREMGLKQFHCRYDGTDTDHQTEVSRSMIALATDEADAVKTILNKMDTILDLADEGAILARRSYFYSSTSTKSLPNTVRINKIKCTDMSPR